MKNLLPLFCLLFLFSVAHAEKYSVKNLGPISDIEYVKINNNGLLLGTRDVGSQGLNFRGPVLRAGDIIESLKDIEGNPILGPAARGINDEGCVSGDNFSWCPEFPGSDRGIYKSAPGMGFAINNNRISAVTSFPSGYFSYDLEQHLQFSFNADPRAINDNQVVVGTRYNRDSYQEAYAAFVNSSNGEENVINFSRVFGSAVSYGNDINNGDEVVGGLAQVGPYGFLENFSGFYANNAEEIYDVITLPGSSVNAINNNGIAVGSSDIGPFIYTKNSGPILITPTDAPGLSGPGYSYTPIDINDCGQILVRSQDNNTYLLTPELTAFVFNPDPVTTSGRQNIVSDEVKFGDLDSFVLNSQRICVKLDELPVTPNALITQLENQYTTVYCNEALDPGCSLNNSSKVFDYSRSLPGFEQVMTFHHITEYRKYLSTLDIPESKLMNFEPTLVQIGTNDGSNTKFPNRGNSLQSKIIFSSGINTQFDKRVEHGEDARIILHEYSHAVVGALSYLTAEQIKSYRPNINLPVDIIIHERMALDEGIADYLQASFLSGKGPKGGENEKDSIYTPWANTFQNALNGEIVGEPTREISTLRTFHENYDPRPYPKDYGENRNTGSQHRNGLIIANFLWDLKTNLGEVVNIDEALLQVVDRSGKNKGIIRFFKEFKNIIEDKSLSTENNNKVFLELCIRGLVNEFKEITFDQSEVRGGDFITGTIDISCPAPYRQAQIKITSNDDSKINKSLKIRSGRNSRKFKIKTSTVEANKDIILQFEFENELVEKTIRIEAGA